MCVSVNLDHENHEISKFTRKHRNGINSLSVIEIWIWIIVPTADCLFLLLQQILLFLRLIRWCEKIALDEKKKTSIKSQTEQTKIRNAYIVINRSRLCYSPLQHFGGEIITATQIVESNDVVLCFVVFYQRYRWYNFDSKALREERTLFRIHFAEFRFNVLFR